MSPKPVHLIFIIGFCLLGAANLLASILTFVVRSQKYGLNDLWKNPDGFAIGTLLIGLLCLSSAWWFYKKSKTIPLHNKKDSESTEPSNGN